MTQAADFFAARVRLEPVETALAGVPPTGELTDYSPAGFEARVELLRRSLPGAGPALAERLGAELAYHEAGLAASLNVVTSPPVLLREHLALLGGDARRIAVEGLGDALDGYLKTLRETKSTRRQVESVLWAARAWATTEEGMTPYGPFADALETEILPHAVEDDAVGTERYRIAARYQLGVDVDPAECFAVLTDELHDLTRAADELGGKQACAEYDNDPSWKVDRADLKVWAEEKLAAAQDRVGVPVGPLEVVVPAEHGPARYRPAAADGSRAAQVVWPVAAPDPVAVWSQTTMLHHEGVPGHHLQLGLGVGADAWSRHTIVAGNSEGWAVYAEGLLLDDMAAPERLGYVMGLRLNTAMALADLALHNGFQLDGAPWTPDRAAEFMAAHSVFPASGLYFSVLRSAAWPAQAITYSWGARVWRELRAQADRAGERPADFHRRMLALGPCGLGVLTNTA